jgi:transcriptional regulator with XRE-family HTH domain
MEPLASCHATIYKTETMDVAASRIPFGERLHTLLESRTPALTQAWVADRAGLDRSLLSRIIQGKRSPTPEVLQCLGPVLGVEIEELVQGTDAEDRLSDAKSSVQQENYEAAVRQIIEYEGRSRDLENRLHFAGEALKAEVKRRELAEGHAKDAHCLKEQLQRELSEARAMILRQEQDLKCYRQGLAKAVAEVGALRSKLQELGAELASTSKSIRTATILSGVAAFAGAVTVAHFLGAEGKEPAAPPKPKRKPARRRSP